MDLSLVLEAIPKACGPDTTQSTWDPDCPVRGHCALASVYIQHLFGGTIARGLMSDGTTHYWNILPNGVWLDSTRAQFANEVYPTYVIADCPTHVYWFEDTFSKYMIFRRRLRAEMGSVLEFEA